MDLSTPLAEATRQRLRVRYGDGVDPWWNNLAVMLDGLATQWKLTLLEPVGKGNSSLVIRCRCSSGQAAILKLTPDTGMALAEATAFRSWQSSGRVPRMFDHDATVGAVLLEAIAGELTVADQETPVALDDVTKLIRALNESGAPVIGGGVTTLADRVEFMFQHWARTHGTNEAGRKVISVERVHRGRDLARSLTRRGGKQVLLHGDLHPNNVLVGGGDRGLVAIDPRPCVGDPAFDTVDWVIWPTDHPHAWESRTANLAADLDLDPEIIWDWCRVFSGMLAASTAARGGPAERIDAFLALAP